MDTIELTVAIRAYNAADRLPRLLEHLRAQVVPATVNWEIVVVDNQSTDGTAAIVQSFQARWQPPGGLHYVFEPELGSAIARRRAMTVARGRWVGFLDDDTWPTATWVAEVVAVARSHPQAGAFNGIIRGDFEQPPPPHFDRIASYLAITDRGPTPFVYGHRGDGVLPPGAGLVIAKEAWQRSVPTTLAIGGPMGTALAIKGEDLETLVHLQKAGWPILHAPSLVIYHHIPAQRLERDYLWRLGYSVGQGQHHIRQARLKSWQRPAYTLLYALNDGGRALVYYATHRTALPHDGVVACQMAKLWGNLLGPFQGR
jgi:glycosyltransferase involved in cell wall biosynthesis